MPLLRRLVFIAAATGLLVGLAMSLLQSLATVPLILVAESYEQAAPSLVHEHGSPSQAHEHASDDAWAPADGGERLLFTVLANVVTAVGFALLLLAASELAGGLSGWRQGVLWGLAGFAVFTLAPSLGLPPELPAMPAAELGARQAWWLGTAAATAAGLSLLAFTRSWPACALALGLLALPHLVGAPQPVSHGTTIPDGLAHRFAVAAIATSFVFWALLGAAAGCLRALTLQTESGMVVSNVSSHWPGFPTLQRRAKKSNARPG